MHPLCSEKRTNLHICAERVCTSVWREFIPLCGENFAPLCDGDRTVFEEREARKNHFVQHVIQYPA